MSILMTDFLVKKDDIGQTKFEEGNVDPAALQAGQVLIRVDKFAFTTNNITYALLGDSRLRYWQFFPASDDGWGKVPVWGFGDVIHSNHEQIDQGERLFGYFPLATHLTIEPDKVTPYNLVDSAAHRQDLNPVYNQYSRVSQNPAHQAEYEGLQALIRPLFVTSFLIDDFLAENDLFGGQTVLFSSASSKTAIGTAYLLHKNRGDREPYAIVGLTSQRNVEFVRGLGFYDQVLAYEEIESLDGGETAVLVDISGKWELIGRLHHHYQENMVYSCMVGFSHGDNFVSGTSLPGAALKLFFAPDQIQKRLADWGGKVFQERTTQAMMAFLGAAQGWLKIREGKGTAVVDDIYQSFLAGNVEPDQGYILSLHGESGA